MSESVTESPIDYVQDASLRDITRFYGERLAFTRRGHFAFIAGLLLLNYNAVSYAVETGTPSADAPIYASSTSLWANTMMALDGLLAVFLAVVFGAGVLLVLDIYEAEVGLSIDPDC